MTVNRTFVLPRNAVVMSFEERLSRIDAPGMPMDWYEHAVAVLRGGDGGEHGTLLYKLARAAAAGAARVVALDVGTARGFSALVVAQALKDANVVGTVYSVDTVGHDDKVNWHIGKHSPDDPLAQLRISRREIWERWFPHGFSSVVVVEGRSVDALRSWEHGSVSIAFLDGSHGYADVSQELALLDELMTPRGVVVLDDYHVGETVGRVRSRAVNFAAWLIGRSVTKMLRRQVNFAPRLGEGSEYRLVKQRFGGVRRAVDEFVKDQGGRWSLEIVSMPTRGDYQGLDYSLAVLTRR